MNVLAAATLLAIGLGGGSALAKDSLFVVVTSPDPQTQAMAMVLTNQALQRQTPVRLLLCGPGGDLALKDYQGSSLQPSGKTPQQMMQAAITAGAQVELCALYLPNSAGKTPADLINGVNPVKPPEIGAHMDQENIRFFTF